jgi:hypothetical protein
VKPVTVGMAGKVPDHERDWPNIGIEIGKGEGDRGGHLCETLTVEVGPDRLFHCSPGFKNFSCILDIHVRLPGKKILIQSPI